METEAKLVTIGNNRTFVSSICQMSTITNSLAIVALSVGKGA